MTDPIVIPFYSRSLTVSGQTPAVSCEEVEMNGPGRVASADEVVQRVLAAKLLPNPPGATPPVYRIHCLDEVEAGFIRDRLRAARVSLEGVVIRSAFRPKIARGEAVQEAIYDD